MENTIKKKNYNIVDIPNILLQKTVRLVKLG